SIAAVLAYLDKVDPLAAKAARERYGCLLTGIFPATRTALNLPSGSSIDRTSSGGPADRRVSESVRVDHGVPVVRRKVWRESSSSKNPTKSLMRTLRAAKRRHRP